MHCWPAAHLNSSFQSRKGQERYRSLAPMYYRGAAAALVVYDITDQVDSISKDFTTQLHSQLQHQQQIKAKQDKH